MKIIHESFNYKKINEGEKYYNKFLSGIPKYYINNINDELINSGLEFMPYYWAGKEKYTKALKVINNGLSIAPQSFKLKKLKRLSLNLKS